MAGRNDGHEMEYSQITENIYIGSDLCNGPDQLLIGSAAINEVEEVRKKALEEFAKLWR